eukprot:8076543-Pyramimonas_sp.AAC.1
MPNGTSGEKRPWARTDPVRGGVSPVENLAPIPYGRPSAADGALGEPSNGPCPRRGVSRGESGPDSPRETIRRGRCPRGALQRA